MADETNFDDLSDEDFLKLSEEDAAKAVASQTPNSEDSQEDEENDNNQDLNENEDEQDEENDLSDSGDEPPVDSDESGKSDDDSSSDAGEGEEDSDGQKDPEGNQDPLKGEGEEQKPDEKGKQQSASNPEEKGKKAETFKLPDGVTAEQVNTALGFYQQITAPFKADGKDFTVRSPEDAIRLMQQGVNYSRRMHELKPMKNLHRMLSDHGLADQNKLSFLIDISRGDKAAITKLLKDNNLDPMDLDISSETGYQAKSYAGNPQDNAFRDALDATIATPEGQALVSEIHKTWDEASKLRLREDPSILGNLLEMKQSGVYGKIVGELEYQRSMGYLTHVPFLQAYDQVGQAMRNAGIFGQQQQPAPAADSMGQLQTQNPPQGQPVASGARKAPAPKKPAPNPHLSSTPPSKQSQAPADGPDFDKMSDEDFLKMAPPS